MKYEWKVNKECWVILPALIVNTGCSKIEIAWIKWGILIKY